MTSDITTVSPMLARVYTGPDHCDWATAYVQPFHEALCVGVEEVAGFHPDKGTDDDESEDSGPP